MTRVLLAVLCAAGLLMAPAVAVAASSARSAHNVPLPAPPPEPTFSWSGCYIGGDVGGAWSRQDANNSNLAINLFFNQAPDFVSLKGSGAIGGLHGRCDLQFANWVAGVEADWGAAHLSDARVGPNNLFTGGPAGAGSVSFSRDVKWITSVRARLGFTGTPNILLYATGGAAWANVSYSGTDTYLGCSPCDPAPFAYSAIANGWVIGGGAEWAATHNWLLRLEYLHYGFQGSAAPVALALPPLPPYPAAQYNFGALHIDEVRAGVSYKFE